MASITSYPPLTTTFMAPSSCSDAPWTYLEIREASGTGTAAAASSPTIPTLYRPWEGGAQLPTDSLTASFDESACLPSGYFQGVNHYSPGICPYGSTTATAIKNTDGASVALCCPSGFTVTDENQNCVSTYTASTTVNYFIDNLDSSSTIEARQGASVGPGVLVVRAAVLMLASTTSTAITQATGSLPNSTQVPETVNSFTVTIAPYQGSGVSNAAVIAITAVVVLAVLGLLLVGYILLQRRSSSQSVRHKSITTSFGNLLLLPIIVAILVGIATCLFASHRSWQEDMVKRWESPNSVLRVIQVLSFVIRLCAGFLAWCCVADVGWWMLSRGLQPAQVVRVLDMSAVGGSYATACDALWSNLRRLSWLNSFVLILAITVAWASDLVGNAIIASTGVGYIAGRNNTASNLPFMQVGYINRDNSTFGSLDQITPLFSSANYYPHILQHNDDTFSFLPVQAGDALPFSYSGIAYFGTLSTDCVSAKLNGSVFVVNYISSGDPASVDNTFGMEGDLEIPFDNIPSISNVSFTKQGMTFTRTSVSNPAPILGAWTANPQANANSSVQYIATLLISNLTESFVRTYTQDAPTSNGSLIINDGQSPDNGQPAGSFAIQVCRITLPSNFGTISAPHIQQNRLPLPAPCSLTASLCPDISVYSAGPESSTTPWTDAEILINLNASYTDFETLTQVMASFSSGVIFCRECNATGIAARVLSSFVADSASSPNLPGTLKTALLHAIAFTYRNELPTLNGAGTALFTLLQPATIVVNATWIYFAVSYVFILILVTVVLRSYTLSIVAVERSGSVLSAASLITSPSPLAIVVEQGSMKNGELLRRDVDLELRDRKMRLGILTDDERFGVGFVGRVSRWRRGRRREKGDGKGQVVGLIEGEEQKAVVKEEDRKRDGSIEDIEVRNLEAPLVSRDSSGG